MTTLAQLKKHTKQSGFHDCLLKHGFEIGPQGLFYYQWRDELLDLVQFWIKTSGDCVEVNVCTTISEIIERSDYDMSVFPNGYSKVAGNPTALNLSKGGIELFGDTWWIRTEDEIESTLIELKGMIEPVLLPWFYTIISRKDIYNSLWINYREGPAADWLRETLL